MNIKYMPTAAHMVKVLSILSFVIFVDIIEIRGLQYFLSFELIFFHF